MSQRVNISYQEFKQAKAKAKANAKAREVHEAARIIAVDGRPINNDWIEDVGSTTKQSEKCTIKLRVKSATSYSEWIDIILDDGTVLLSTYYYISGSGNSEFEASTFRNGAWVERFITYSTEGVNAELERQKKAELEQRLKPYAEIDF